jgi:hypothetical protein
VVAGVGPVATVTCGVLVAAVLTVVARVVMSGVVVDRAVAAFVVQVRLAGVDVVRVVLEVVCHRVCSLFRVDPLYPPGV